MRDARLQRFVAVSLAVLLVLSAMPLLAEEQVAFNVESKKYHCLECRHAKACTRNCIVVPLPEAKRRGGVPCKVCGGSCG
jgi:hypothetical protein